jgi:hypothetical protein
MNNTPIRNTTAGQMLNHMPRMILRQLQLLASHARVDLNTVMVDNPKNDSYLVGEARTGKRIRVTPDNVAFI